MSRATRIVGDPPTRFWPKVDRDGVGGCWVWLAGTQGDGYGSFGISSGNCVLAHRFAYELLVGPVPTGLQLDHLCRNRRCVNPAHLEPVTAAENMRRGAKGVLKTHCVHGHLFTPATTYVDPNGHRTCIPCRRAVDARRRPPGSRSKRAQQ